MDEDVLEIDVWSDLVCPWCYIGKPNLASPTGTGYAGIVGLAGRWKAQVDHQPLC
ncbi:DsbA family protein [Nocardia sp. NPDC050799]|uniref:DsbA family protein n=1 Tax=Nocardia sp. NPDC050799 TaxID=3154842 RepID=UPI003401600B